MSQGDPAGVPGGPEDLSDAANRIQVPAGRSRTHQDDGIAISSREDRPRNQSGEEFLKGSEGTP